MPRDRPFLRTAEQHAADVAAATVDPATRRVRDPVTGALLPEGQVLVPDPSRAQRRALEAWRSAADKDRVPSAHVKGRRAR